MEHLLLLAMFAASSGWVLVVALGLSYLNSLKDEESLRQERDDALAKLAALKKLLDEGE